MKQVASLQYGVIFKKAFSQIDVFKAFVKDIVGIDLEIDKVEFIYLVEDNQKKESFIEKFQIPNKLFEFLDKNLFNLVER